MESPPQPVTLGIPTAALSSHRQLSTTLGSVAKARIHATGPIWPGSTKTNLGAVELIRKTGIGNPLQRVPLLRDLQAMRNEIIRDEHLSFAAIIAILLTVDLVIAWFLFGAK